MADDPANWVVGFDEENQCNYYYNNVTQESSWSRPSCLGFSSGNSQKQLEGVNDNSSKKLMASAFGFEEAPEDESFSQEQYTASNTEANNKNDNVAESFDSNDEFFAQLEAEQDAIEENKTQEGNHKEAEEEAAAAAAKARAEKEAEEKRQAEKKKAEEEAAAAAVAKARAEKEAEEKRQAEKKKAEEEAAAAAAKARAEKEAEEKRQAEKKKAEEEAAAAAVAKARAEKEAEEKRQAEKKKAEEEAAAAAAKARAEKEAEEKRQAEKKKAEEEAAAAAVAKARAEKEAEEKRQAEKKKAEEEAAAAAAKVKTEKEAEEVPDDIEAVATTKPVEDNTPAVEVEEDSSVKKLSEDDLSSPVKLSYVEDSVERERAATKLQSVQRGRVAKNKVEALKKRRKKATYDQFIASQEQKEQERHVELIQRDSNRKNEAAIKLQSKQRQRSSKKLAEKLKADRRNSSEENLSNNKENTDKGDVVGQDSALKGNPSPLKKQYYGYKKDELKRAGISNSPKKTSNKRVRVNNPRDAIAEAAKYLDSRGDGEVKGASGETDPPVPETTTRTTTDKNPDIFPSIHVSKDKKPRQNRIRDLEHVNNRNLASLEKLEKMASETDPKNKAKRMESSSAPNGRLPKIEGRRSESTRRKKKEPLFMRLEAEGRARSLAIEKEKQDRWQQIREINKRAKPSKEALLEHMQKCAEQRKAHEEKEREYAEAKKKEWNEGAKKLKKMHKIPPRTKVMPQEDALKEKASPPKIIPSPKSTPRVTPRKVKKKLLRGKKLDFVEEERERKEKEEMAKKERIAKGRMYGKVAPVKHAKDVSPARRPLHLIEEVPPLEPPAPIMAQGTPSPRYSKKVHSGADDVDTDEARDVIRSPKPAPRKKSHPTSSSGDTLSPLSSNPKKSKRSPSATLEDSSNSASHSSVSTMAGELSAPYDGQMGSEWVSRVMEMDKDESTLAEVYESGFEMFMIEKGIIQDVN